MMPIVLGSLFNLDSGSILTKVTKLLSKLVEVKEEMEITHYDWF